MTIADHYARQRPWRPWGTILSALPLKQGQLVVDLGCGIGDLAADLAARGARVLGVDANREFLDVARRRDLPGARFIEADLRTWTDPGLSADGLWCSFATAYFTEFEPVLRRWLAALRPGAWVALVEVDDFLCHEPLSASTKSGFRRYADEALAAGRYDFRMGRKLEAFARAAGLQVITETGLPDQELSFQGAASPDVIEAWDRRLSGMKLLHRCFGPRWETVKKEFLDCLADPDHTCTAAVVFVRATTPTS